MQALSQILQLPKRQKGSYTNTFKKVQIVSNDFRVKVKIDTVYLYKLQLEPLLEETNKARRSSIYAQCNELIRQHIRDPIFSGSIVYCSKKPSWGDINKFQFKFEDQQFELCVRLLKSIKFLGGEVSDIKNQLVFLNNYVRTLMRRLNFIQIGSSKKFFDASSMRHIPDIDMVIYDGYTTNFCKLETGLFLKIDTLTKLVVKQSVLQYINDIYQRNIDKDKNLRRQIVVDSLIGKTVMANYGKSMYWRVENVVFGHENKTYSIGNKEITLAEYYFERYGLVMEVKNQPLLEATVKNETIFLIPEFCLITGLPEYIDERKRREISREIVKEPEVKIQRLIKFRQTLDKQLKDLNPEEIKNKLGISISEDLTAFEAKRIDLPKIELGEGHVIDNGRQVSFKLFDRPLYDASKEIRCCVLHFSNFDFTPIKKLFETSSQHLNLKFKMRVGVQGDYSATSALETLLREIRYMHRKGEFNIYMVILPFSARNLYKSIKQICCCELGVLVQVVVDVILKKKEFQTVATKVLLQMAAKVGNVLWVPRTKLTSTNNIMLLAIHTSTDKGPNPKARLAYCVSTNKDLTMFSSHSETQDINCPIIEHIQNILFKSIKTYYSANKHLPSEVIILRDGCPPHSTSALLECEVQSCIKATKEFESPIGLNFVVIDKRSSQKFYQKFQNKYYNPTVGTLINSDVVSPNYDFYLISQMSLQGSVIPTYYEVLYSESKLEEGMLQEILYYQCFNYANWTGSIKIPAVIQYARKLCEFAAANLPEQSILNLDKNLYYI